MIRQGRETEACSSTSCSTSSFVCITASQKKVTASHASAPRLTKDGREKSPAIASRRIRMLRPSGSHLHRILQRVVRVVHIVVTPMSLDCPNVLDSRELVRRYREPVRTHTYTDKICYFLSTFPALGTSPVLGVRLRSFTHTYTISQTPNL